MISSAVACLSAFTVISAMPAGVYIGDGGEVGASFGGYSASAGLGGIVGGAGPKGGLHAEAGTPTGQFAGAGLGGNVGGGPAGGGYAVASSSSSAGASYGGGAVHPVAVHPSKKQGSLFDDIFNIPQSVLRSVNELLNKKGPVQKGHPTAHTDGIATKTSASASSDASVNSIQQNGSSTKYDQIFAIPQSALSAVAQLLNRNFGK